MPSDNTLVLLHRYGKVSAVATTPAHHFPEHKGDCLSPQGLAIQVLGLTMVMACSYSRLLNSLEYSCNKYYDLIGYSEVSISHRDLQV